MYIMYHVHLHVISILCTWSRCFVCTQRISSRLEFLIWCVREKESEWIVSNFWPTFSLVRGCGRSCGWIKIIGTFVCSVVYISVTTKGLLHFVLSSDCDNRFWWEFIINYETWRTRMEEIRNILWKWQTFDESGGDDIFFKFKSLLDLYSTFHWAKLLRPSKIISSVRKRVGLL